MCKNTHTRGPAGCNGVCEESVESVCVRVVNERDVRTKNYFFLKYQKNIFFIFKTYLEKYF